MEKLPKNGKTVESDSCSVEKGKCYTSKDAKLRNAATNESFMKIGKNLGKLRVKNSFGDLSGVITPENDRRPTVFQLWVLAFGPPQPSETPPRFFWWGPEAQEAEKQKPRGSHFSRFSSPAETDDGPACAVSRRAYSSFHRRKRTKGSGPFRFLKF